MIPKLMSLWIEVHIVEISINNLLTCLKNGSAFYDTFNRRVVLVIIPGIFVEELNWWCIIYIQLMVERKIAEKVQFS